MNVDTSSPEPQAPASGDAANWRQLAASENRKFILELHEDEDGITDRQSANIPLQSAETTLAPASLPVAKPLEPLRIKTKCLDSVGRNSVTLVRGPLRYERVIYLDDETAVDYFIDEAMERFYTSGECVRSLRNNIRLLLRDALKEYRTFHNHVLLPDDPAPRIVWENQPLEITVERSTFKPDVPTLSNSNAVYRSMIHEWLRNQLQTGERFAQDVLAAATVSRIGQRSLRLALREIGGTTRKGSTGMWVWALSDKSSTDSCASPKKAWPCDSQKLARQVGQVDQVGRLEARQAS